MVFDVKDYNKWAKSFESAGGEPCIHRYLRHLIYKDANSEPKHTSERETLQPMVMLK